MKTYKGNRGKYSFFKFRARWRWVVNSTPPAAVPPRKETRYPRYMRLGGPHGGFGRAQNISPSQEFAPQTFQIVANRYTDYVIPADVNEAVRTTYCEVLTKHYFGYLRTFVRMSTIVSVNKSA